MAEAKRKHRAAERRVMTKEELDRLLDKILDNELEAALVAIGLQRG